MYEFEVFRVLQGEKITKRYYASSNYPELPYYVRHIEEENARRIDLLQEQIHSVALGAKALLAPFGSVAELAARARVIKTKMEEEADGNQAPVTRDVWDPRTFWGLVEDRPERQMVLRPTI